MAEKQANPLAAALNLVRANSMPKEEGATGRAGKSTTIAYVDEAGKRELKTLALDSGRTVQSLLVEAINDLLVKHGKKPLA